MRARTLNGSIKGSQIIEEEKDPRIDLNEIRYDGYISSLTYKDHKILGKRYIFLYHYYESGYFYLVRF